MAKQLGFLELMQSAGATAKTEGHADAASRATSEIGKSVSFLEATTLKSESAASIAEALREESLCAGTAGDEQADDGWKEFSHNGRNWQFDEGQLAAWDEEDEAFHFHSYHGLAEPTPEALSALIDQH